MNTITFKRILNAAASLAALALLSVACRQEPLSDVLPAGADAERMTLKVSIAQAEQPDTKASMLSGAESAGSGALVLVYRSDNGKLDGSFFFTQAQLDNQASTPLQISVPRTNCDFYVLGNLNFINKSSGAAVDMATMLGSDLFTNESELEVFEYRLDGGDLTSAYRRETMAEVATYGIPYQHIVKNVNVLAQAGIPGANACRRLFSKVSVTINHGTFDGGDPAKVDYFVNKRLYMRQVNCLMRPFSTDAVKATAASDLTTGDYDEAMANANSGTYVFYVPENMQGTVSGITDPKNKTLTNTSIPEAVRTYGTYVEFTGTLNSAAGGFGGDVTYKFFLGENNTTNFNVVRSKDYQVTLGFTSDGLFNPYWKVNASLTDTRLFCLTADPAYGYGIESVSGGLLAVRASRVGKVYVYMNPVGDMGSTNLLLGKDVTAPASFVMDDMSDCAWYAPFMVPGTEDANWLADRGITVSWNSADGSLTFTRTDQAKFVAHLGDERTFTIQLLPGDSKTATVKVKLLADMTASVADGLSLTEDFYIGQKRSVSVTGFSGSTIKYAAVQEPCGSASGTAKNANRQWKAVNTGTFDSGYPTCAVDAAGNPVYNPSDAAYASQTFSGSLDVYAWYPNRFQSSHSGWSSMNGKIVVFSDDWLNDCVEIPVRISEPVYTPFAFTSAYSALPWKQDSHFDTEGLSQSMILNIDGTEFTTCDAPTYSTFDGSAVLEESSFDETLYASLLGPSVTSDGNNTQKACAKGIRVSSEGKIYVGSTLNDGVKMEERSYGNIQYGASSMFVYNGKFYDVGTCTISPNAVTGLFAGSNSFKLYLEKTTFTVGFGNWEGWYASPLRRSVSTNSSNIYYFAPDDIGGDIYCFEYSLSFNAKANIRTPDPTHITRTGPATSCLAKGVEYGPDPTIVTDGNTIHCVFSHENPGKVVDGEFVPTSICLPYGEQTFTYTFSNKWDGREWTVSNSRTFKYYMDANALMVFHRSPTYGNARAMSMVCTTPYECYLLSVYGASMSASNRSFCTFALERNVGSYYKFSTYLSCDYTLLDVYDRPTLEYNDATYAVSMNIPHTWDFGSAEVASSIYNYPAGGGIAAFDYGPWTEASAKHFCWDRTDNHPYSESTVIPAFSMAGYFRYSHTGTPSVNPGEGSENWKTQTVDYDAADFLTRFSGRRVLVYSLDSNYRTIPTSYTTSNNHLLPSISGRQRWGRWVLFLGDQSF